MSNFITVVTPGLLRPDFYILRFFVKIFEKIRVKTLIPPDCYTFLRFFCNSPGVTTVVQFFRIF